MFCILCHILHAFDDTYVRRDYSSMVCFKSYLLRKTVKLSLFLFQKGLEQLITGIKGQTLCSTRTIGLNRCQPLHAVASESDALHKLDE